MIDSLDIEKLPERLAWVVKLLLIADAVNTLQCP